jgi:hypothetical protein
VKFPSARIIKLRNFDIGCIIITIIFFINFYFLLTTVILTYDLLMIIYCSIIYFFGIIIQVSIFPIPGRAEGIIEFTTPGGETVQRDFAELIRRYAIKHEEGGKFAFVRRYQLGQPIRNV